MNNIFIKKHNVKTILVLIVLSICMLVSGCTESSNNNASMNISSNENQRNGNSGAENESNNSSKKIINVTLNESNIYERMAINRYSHSNKLGVKLVPTFLNYETFMHTKEKRLAEIMAGDGPDILIEMDGMKLLDNYKAVTSGYYYDIGELMDDDPWYNPSDYFQPVMEAGVFSGKRLFIPMFFTVPKFVTTEEYIKKYQLDINEDKWDWDAFKNMTMKYMQSDFSKNTDLLNQDFEDELLEWLSSIYVSHDERTCNFYNDSFIEKISFLKEARAVLRLREEDDGRTMRPYWYLENELALFINDKVFIPQGISEYGTRNKVQGIYGEKFGISHNPPLKLTYKVLPVPPLDDEHRLSYRITSTIGISDNSSYKEEAYDFIKFLLQKDLMDNFNADEIYQGVPIVKDAYIERYVSYWNDVPSEIEEVKRGFEDLLSTTLFQDKLISSIVKEYYYSFVDGKITAQEAAQNIDEKVYMYLNE